MGVVVAIFVKKLMTASALFSRREVLYLYLAALRAKYGAPLLQETTFICCALLRKVLPPIFG
jgi:hypothetical protein